MAQPSEQATRVTGEVVESEHAVRLTFTGLTRREKSAIEQIVVAHRRVRSISWKDGNVLVCVIKQRNGGRQPVEFLMGSKRSLLGTVREELDGLQARSRGTGQPPLLVRHHAARRGLAWQA